MDYSYVSLDPVQPSKPGPHASPAVRTHEGIPGIERSPNGRLFAVWYAGGTTECRENYAMLVVSDDDGKTWSDAVAVVDPPHPFVRAFDSTLWYAPNGKLYWFWAQSCGGYDSTWQIADGIVGVWYSIIENPDDDPASFRFSPSRRIANGIMMNKPTVLADGTWAFPCSVWTGNYPKHESLNVQQGAYMVVSEDQGETFHIRGRIHMANVEGGPIFDEHMFVQHNDGRVVCYIRVKKGTAESTSYDNGKTWTPPTLSTNIGGPNSRLFIRRLKSGRLLLVNNDSNTKREKMTAFLSDDDGKSWPHKLLLDLGKHDAVSYPDGVQAPDGTLYIIHDYARQRGGHIFMSRITEDDIIAGKLVSDNSQLKIHIASSFPVPGKTSAPLDD